MTIHFHADEKAGGSGRSELSWYICGKFVGKNELSHNISVNYILCPHCTTKISEETILANADCRGKVAMLCPTCSESLRFRLRGATLEHLKARYAELAPEGEPVRAYLQLIANDFAYAALLPLYEGCNTIGSYNGRGTSVTTPIHSSDPSLGRNHCQITIESDGQAIIQDLDSMTGTFVAGVEYLPDTFRELQSGDVITLGATSLIYVTRTDYEETNP